MTERPGAHQAHDSSHQSINILALIGLIGDQFPSLQQNPSPTWYLGLSDNHPEHSGEQMYDEGLTGRVNTHTHTCTHHHHKLSLWHGSLVFGSACFLLTTSARVPEVNNFFYLTPIFLMCSLVKIKYSGRHNADTVLHHTLNSKAATSICKLASTWFCLYRSALDLISLRCNLDTKLYSQTCNPWEPHDN